jgi:plasmid maintenance system killer protein
MTFSKLKMMANSKLKQVLSSKEEKHKEELKENSNLVYDILS